MLTDEQLEGEVAGVESPGERSQLRLVNLESHHLADADLHPVQSHRPVVLEVRQHEEEREELALGFLQFGWFACLPSGAFMMYDSSSSC